MLENYNLILISGGFHRCDPTWSRPKNAVDPCYKIYFPIAGEALLETATHRYPLTKNRIYFISGFQLSAQMCETYLDVFWLHFVPESLYLRYLLDQLPPVQSWSCKADRWSENAGLEIGQIFASPLRPDHTPPATVCTIQGILMGLIGRLLQSLDQSTMADFHPRYYQLKPALDFLQNHYLENPPLEEIAGQVHLAPNYFHRQFRQLFGVTPFNYMMIQRLNKAGHLLSSTTLSVKEIAEAVGYDNPLYFTRVFTAGMAISPTRYRLLHSAAKSEP